MTLSNSTRRRAAHQLALAGATLSAVVMALSGWALVSPGRASAAAVNAGAAQIVQPSGGAGAGQPLASGGSATSFNLKLPTGAACAADGNSGGRWHTYMIPSAENPADIAFAGSGALVGASTGTGGTGTFRNNVYSTTGTPVRGQAPNLGDAVIINIPNMRLSVWSPGNIPLGAYNIGIGCVDLDTAERDNFWNTQLTIEADEADPDGIKWVATTTSTTTTSTTASSSTTTGGSTSSTATTTTGGSSSSTSTSIDDTTSTSTDDFSSTSDTSTDVLGVGVDDTSGGGDSALPATGLSVAGFVVSSALLLYLGRLAVLLGRPTPVLGRDR